MIILNLIVFKKEQINDVVNSILKSKWALKVIVGNAMDYYYMDDSSVKNHSWAYPIQFVTKSLLVSEMETTLKIDFPGMDFIIYAPPAVHIDAVYYDKIKNGVTGFAFLEKN